MGKIIDGRKVALKSREEIENFINDRISLNKKLPCIAIILVGNDGGSLYYANNQIKICDKLGVKVKYIHLEENTSQEEVIDYIENLNEDNNVDGIILMLPLPDHLNEKFIISKISYKKDLDGLTDINCGRLYKGEKCFIPCTPRGVIELIKSTGIDIEGKRAVIIGRSNIVGKPVAQLLLNENATVTICHSRTKNLKRICKEADVLISAIGKPGFVGSDFIKEGAIVIDVGTTMVNDKLQGDVAFDEVINKASFVTPVPGGVGSMTTTMLIKNVCEALE